MHKRIGILGGMSPESTIEYYQYMVHRYFERFGDHRYPEILIYSVHSQDYYDWPFQARWDLIAEGLSAAGRKLIDAGADFLIISTNLMHIVFDQVKENTGAPMVSLLDVVAEAILAKGFRTVGLLGAKFTMEHGYYQNGMVKKGIEVIIPEERDREYVSKVIYEELIAGKFLDESRAGYIDVIKRLVDRGAEGVILGCTEIPLLVSESDAGLPLFDTTRIHAEAALNYAVGND